MMPNPAHSESLQALELSINAILLHTASVFLDPTKSNARELSQTNARLKRAIPGAIADFHDALDDLEAELICARAVMRRDLAEFRNTASSKAQAVQVPIVTSEAKSREQSAEIPDRDQAETQGPKDAPPDDATNAVSTGAPESDNVDKDGAQQEPQLDDTAALEGEEKDIDMSAAPATNEDDIGDSTVDGQGESGAEAATGKKEDSDDGPLEDTSPAQDSQAGTEAKDGNDEASEAFSNMDVGSLLPGLEMYANDPSSASFNDINSFTGLDTTNDGGGINTDHMMNELGQEAGNGFDDLFDLGEFGGESGENGEFATNAGGFHTQFDENFFNLD